MVEFIPFQGYRPQLRSGELIEERVSPPYDVIDEEALKRYQSMPGNVTRLTLLQDTDKRYHSARAMLDMWSSDGSLKQDPDSYYIYEQTFTENGEKKVRTGIMGALKADGYEAGNVIPHEETFSKVKEDRLNLLRDMEAHLESIFGIFKGFSNDLRREIEDNALLTYRFVDVIDHVEHKFYRITDDEIAERIMDELKDQKILIADGHHRYETACNYAKENPDDPKKGYVLATLVAEDDPGLVIRPTHRLVSTESISEKNAIKGMSEALEMTEVSEAELDAKLKDHMMGMIFKSGRCFVADAKDTEGMMGLDTYVVQEKILKGVYKSDEGKGVVSYDADIGSVKEKMKAKKHDVAIVLNEPSLQTIWDLSVQGKRMPKKTTFFYPKIWSGFVFYFMR